MNLPEENASTDELKAFAASLGDDRRLRLAAALLAPTVEGAQEAKDDETFDDDYDDAVGVLAAACTEFGISDADYDAFASAVFDAI